MLLSVAHSDKQRDIPYITICRYLIYKYLILSYIIIYIFKVYIFIPYTTIDIFLTLLSVAHSGKQRDIP